MKVKYKTLIRSVPALRFLCECDDIPFSCSLCISRNVDIIDGELEIIAKQIKLLNEKYLTKNDTNDHKSDSTASLIKKGCEEAYFNDRLSLFEFEVDLPIMKFDPSFLEKINIKPKYVESIGFMLKDEVK